MSIQKKLLLENITFIALEYLFGKLEINMFLLYLEFPTLSCLFEKLYCQKFIFLFLLYYYPVLATNIKKEKHEIIYFNLYCYFNLYYIFSFILFFPIFHCGMLLRTITDRQRKNKNI